MATIKNEFDYIQEARSQLAEALVNKFGVREQDILNTDGSIKSTGLWASNSDGSKNYLKRLHDWVTLVTATNVHTDASLTFKDNGRGDEVGTTFNGSVAKSISYNSIGAAPVGHTHTTKIETSTGTSQIALAYGGKYKLTAGGTTYVFTMPSSDNTWRPIGTGANDAAAGNHIHKNLIIKWGTGNTEDTDLFTYNGSTAKTIDLNIPISQLFTNFSNVGSQTTRITIGGVTKDLKIDADTIDGYHAKSRTNKPWGAIPVIGTDGVIELGCYIDLHYDNTTGSDYSTRLQVSGNHNNIVNLPSATGTLALTSQIPNVTDYYWADQKVSNSSNAATSPTVALLKATTGVQIGSTTDYGWYLSSSRICAGKNAAKGINVGSLLVSNAWSDSSKVPTNGIYSEGNISAAGFVKASSSDSYVLLGGGGHKALSDFSRSHNHPYLPLTGGTMTGAINFYNTNAKLAFGSLTQSPITGYEAPYLSTNGVGIYSRYEDGSDEGAIIITEDTCVIYNSADTGWNFQVMDTDLGKDMSNDATRSFGVNQNHQAWSLEGFVKNGSSNNYVLLGGGGHKLVSDFATKNWVTNNYYSVLEMSENYYNIVNIDSMFDDFLPKSGGTVTGTLNVKDLVVNPRIYESSKTDSHLVFQAFMVNNNTKRAHNYGYGADVITFGKGWTEMTPEYLYYNGYIHTTKHMRIKDVLLSYDPSNNTLNLRGVSGQTVHLASTGTVYAMHFYENSDIRYKKILRNLSIDSNTIANLPLFDFEWTENNSIGTGTSAQAVQQILPNLVSGTDKLTLDYGVLGTIAGVAACKELVSQKSEIEMLKDRVKQLEQQLKMYNG